MTVKGSTVKRIVWLTMCLGTVQSEPLKEKKKGMKIDLYIEALKNEQKIKDWLISNLKTLFHELTVLLVHDTFFVFCFTILQTLQMNLKCIRAVLNLKCLRAVFLGTASSQAWPKLPYHSVGSHSRIKIRSYWISQCLLTLKCLKWSGLKKEHVSPKKS